MESSSGPGVLVANRGEVAVRVLRSAAELGYRTVAVRATGDSEDTAARLADVSVELPGSGPAAYLDVDALVSSALRTGCSLLHPGWGFASESPALARAAAEAGVTFVGPPADVLALFGDKVAARALAVRTGVPVVTGTAGPVGPAEALEFAASLPAGTAVVVKALAGGGGRGLRVVRPGEDLAAALDRSRSEAQAAFGSGEVFLEARVDAARHVEVQVVADASGAVIHLGERDCSVQRRHQKIIEAAPAPGLDPGLRRAVLDAALRLATAGGYRNVGTFEFLVATDGSLEHGFAFMEANPRLQVEHTVTEELYGLDLVAVQLRVAEGAALADLGLAEGLTPPAGFALQARVNAERVTPTGEILPSVGEIARMELPAGPGVRVDTHARPGYRPDPRFDSLLAKVVVRTHAPGFPAAAAKLAGALGEVVLEGVDTNIAFLRNILARPEVVSGGCTTAWVDANIASLAPAAGAVSDPAEAAGVVHGGGVAVAAHTTGVVVAVDVALGGEVAAGGSVVVVEAMKMEHPVTSPDAGTVRAVHVSVGDTVAAGQIVAVVDPGDVSAAGAAEAAFDVERVRPDLEELLGRRELLSDDARPEAVQRRHGTGKRTARENIADLVDPGSFEEYGAFAVAAQASRRSAEDLRANTPADGLVSGVARVNGDVFGPDRARCAVVAYDYTVLAGTQGQRNHHKKDRIFELAERLRLPVVLFAEGGGGRPGDTDVPVISGLDTRAFALYARLSGLVPLVGVVEGRCFAGNAALLGCSDVIIATEDANIGMGGPAMIEGGGLGTFRPEDIGPAGVQSANGVIDVLVADDREAVSVAKRYLSYFQGPVPAWDCADQRVLRHLIPENRLRAYDVRTVVDALADRDSVLELRAHFGVGIITALARVEGRPVGILANNPAHLGGAIDAPAADKAARFMQLCDAFDVPLLFLCDTPGFMVGPEAERSAQVRRFSRMFVVGASLTVPFFTIVLRKGYGLGAQAMAGGSFREPLFTVSWPTGEFGGMGLEGAVRLGMRRELEAVPDPEEREALFQRLVAAAYQRGKALNMATNLEIDDVIDPYESRARIIRALDSAPPPAPRAGKKRPCVDTW
ncbi:MAG TPA: carboxyl transferase domain-containing protein [Acidimicrobiales bacterium]|nr:carboxyl transferase domain-containing protein [Acidimicrobiales bacterium]